MKSFRHPLASRAHVVLAARTLLLFTWGWLQLCDVGLANDVSDPPWRAEANILLRDYCLDCHVGEDAEAGFDLTQLSQNLSDAEQMRRWVLVHDRIAKGEMPPAEASQPAEAEQDQFLRILSQALQEADKRRSDVVLRRLNRNEYQNTVRDLFDVHVEVRQLLPRDGDAFGFDNVGEGLATSPEAAQAYLRAADATLDAVFGPEKPPERIHHETNLLEQKTHDGKPLLANKIGKMFRQTEHGLVIFQSGYCPTNLVNFSRLRAPAGTYRGTMRVRAVQSDKPVTLRIYGGDTIVGRREKHLVGYFDVPPGEWTTIEFIDRLVEPNGTFQPKCYGTKDTRKNADSYPEPGIEIGDITIEGPLEPWPPASRAKLLGNIDVDSAGLQEARDVLERLLPRAFRRNVSDEELTPYLQLIETALAEDRSFEASLRLGLKAVLCSPEFLFLDEPAAGKADSASTKQHSPEPPVDQFSLASRLSFFLWSSMPDGELRELAGVGLLDDPKTLRSQVERMLADPRSEALRVNFLGQWLDLRDIDFTSPDEKLYPEFDELLQLSMVEETHLFFQELLDKDLSLLNAVDSDFTFLNERLAKHYGVGDGAIQGQAFRRVELPDESVRGGILTQASVLKVTANGTNTSPVLRGVWVLDNILGEQMPPPPAGVAAVEPDIRGTTTIREQLAAHRDAESCARCHRRIDPAGFALENFDVIGGWRDRYRTLGDGERPSFSRHPITFAWVRYRLGRAVDASGETAAGQDFRDIRGFKRALLKKPDAIARALTEKLATYAVGRRIGFSDRPEIERIVGSVADSGYGLRTLIHEIVQSNLFRRP